MVQVDVFWAYAYGAGFSIAAFRQLKKITEEAAVQGGNTGNVRKKDENPARKNKMLFENKYFVQALLYIAILFVPSGAYLLWNFPSWETMHAGTYIAL